MSYHTREILCPFYDYNMKCYIACERGARVTLPNGKATGKYIEQYCGGDYKRCSLSLLLASWYEEVPTPKPAGPLV